MKSKYRNIYGKSFGENVYDKVNHEYYWINSTFLFIRLESKVTSLFQSFMNFKKFHYTHPPWPLGWVQGIESSPEKGDIIKWKVELKKSCLQKHFVYFFLYLYFL